MDEETQAYDATLEEVKGNVYELSGVSVMDDADTYKSTYKVLEDISKVWDKLTDKQKAGTLENLFGKRQANVGAAIISNFSQAQKAIQMMGNAAGSADKEFAKAQQGISYKLNALKETSVGIWQNLIDSDAVKGGVDLLTNLLGVVDKLTSALGSLGTVSLAGGIFATAKGFDITKSGDYAKRLSNVFKNLTDKSTQALTTERAGGFLNSSTIDAFNKGLIDPEQVSSANSALANYLKTVDVGKASVDGFAKSQTTLSGAVTTSVPGLKGLGESLKGFLSNALKAGAASLALGIALKGITVAYDFIEKKVNATKYLEQDVNELSTSYQETSSKIDDVNTQLEKNKTRIAEIKVLGKLTYIDKAELNNLENTNKQLETQKKILEEQQKQQSKKLANKTAKLMDSKGYTLLDNDKDYKSSIKDFQKYAKENQNWKYSDTNDLAKNIAQYKDLNNALTIVKQSSAEYEKTQEDLANSQSTLNDTSSKLTEYMNNMQEEYNRITTKVAKGEILTTSEKNVQKMYEKAQLGVKEIQKALSPENFKSNALNEIFETKGLEKTKKELLEMAKVGSLKDLDLSKYPKLKQALKDASVSTKDLKNELKAMANTSIQSQIDANTTKINSLTQAVKSSEDVMKDFNTALKEANSSTGLSSDSLTNLKTMFGSLKGYNPSTLFERTANGISLNKTQLRELTKEYVATQKLQYAEELQKLVDQYNSVTVSIKKCTNEKKRETLIEQQTTLSQQIEQVRELSAQYDGLTSAYGQWESAMSGTEDGDVYDALVSKLDDIKKLYDNGDVGTEKFRTSAQLMTNKDLSTASVEEVVKAYETGLPKIKRYFKEGTEGTENFLKDVQKANKEWAHINKDGNWEINFTSDKDVADKLGINVESVEQILKKLRDQGFEIHIDSENATKTIEELKDDAKSAKEALQQSLGSEFDVNLKVNKDNVDEQINTVKAKFDELDNRKNSLTAPEIKDYNNLKTLLEYLIKQKQSLTAPAYMSIDTSGLQKDWASAIKLVQQYTSQKDQIDLNKSLNIDTTESEKKLEETLKKIEKIKPSIKVDLGFADSNGNALSESELKKKLDSGNVNVKKSKEKDKVTVIKAKVDASGAEDLAHLSDGFAKLEDKDVKVKVDTSGADKIKDLQKWLKPIVNKNVDVKAKTTGNKEVKALKNNVNNVKNKNVLVKAKTNGTKGVSELQKSIKSVKNKNTTITAKTKGVKGVQQLIDKRSKLKDKSFTVTVNLNDKISPKLSSLESRINKLGANVSLSEGKSSSSKDKGSKSSSKGKKSKLRGSAYYNGSTTGNWRVGFNGTSLGGEEGAEILVNSKTGTWRTIGENGAEFFHHNANDIIFNAAQSQELLEKGRINSRGQSFLNGTAYKKGSTKKSAVSTIVNTIKSTYGNGKFLKKSSGTSSSKKKKSSSSKSNSTKSSSSSSSSSTADKTEENLDWIERALKLVDRVVKNVQQAVDNVYSNWSKRNSQIYEEIYQLGQQLNYYQFGYDSYMAAANAVQLDESYKKKIRDGNFSIETITDENLKTAVSRYKELYDNAMDCADKLQEIRESIGDAYKKAFDNIAKEFENRIKQLDDSVTNLESRFELSKYKSSGFNNDYLSNQIDLYTSKFNELTNEISSLENKLREAVNSGYVDSYSEAYQEMSSTLSDLKNQLVEAEKSISETYEKIFDNVTTKYEKQIEYYQSFIDQLDKSKTLAETKGRVASESYYKAMVTYQKKNIENMKSQEKALTDSLNQALETNSIVAYSEKWYELTNSIHEVQQSLEEANNTLEEFKNNIRQIKWDKFDYLEDEISKITEEAKFFEDLFDNETLYDTDTGKNTKYGDAMLGLHAVSYSTYKSQANDYAKAIKELDKEFKNDSLNKDYLDRRNELVKSQREFILNANDEKQAIKDLIKNGYDAQLNALKELIDKRKDLLSQQKDLYDYEKQINEKTQNISTLQKQLNAYSGDDSEESLKNIQSIKSDLQNAKDELDQTEYDKYISDQEAMLDNLATDFEDWINQRLEEFNANFDKVLEGIDTNANSISATINEAAKQNGIDLSSSFNTIFNSNTTTITSAINGINNALSPIGTAISQIKAYVEFMYSQAKAEADRKAAEQKAKEEAERKAAEEAKRKQQEEAARKAAEAQAAAQQAQQQQQQNDRRSIFTYKSDSFPKNRLNIRNSVVDALKYVDVDSSFGKRSQYYSALGGSGAYTGSSSQNTWLLSQVRSIFGFAQGGEIGALKSVIRGNGDDSLAINTFKQGEKIIPLNRVPEWDKLIDTLPTLNGVLSSVGSSSVEVGQFNVTLPNVKNYQEFKEALVKDNSFNKAIAVMLDSSINNKNSLNRLRFK